MGSNDKKLNETGSAGEAGLEEEKVRAEMEAVGKALEEAKTKAEENWNQFLRARADLENVRKRAQLDVENAHKYGVERFVRELIPVVDSLEQGLAAAESAGDSAYREGIALTLKLLLDIFDKHGIKRLAPKPGEAFDPSRHEAISTQDHPDLGPNKVILVAQQGFILNDRVLRPARVVVSKQA